MASVNPAILREYDIRGLAEEDLPAETVRLLGQAYGTWLKRRGGRRMALGRDCRTHSPRIEDAFAEGATAAGVDVLHIGEVPTPLLYYSLFRLPVDGGVQVTASHNPGEYNGFKVCVGREALHGADIRALGDLANRGDFEAGRGTRGDSPGLVDRYIEEWKPHGQGMEGFTVVMDGGNGMGGTVAPRLFRDLGVVLHGLYLEPDGSFPNHEADPTQEKNLVDLRAEVKRTGAPVGIAYDGDADRLGAVDHEGRIVWGDQLLMLFARDLLARGPATILCDVKCTDLLEDDVPRHGGQLVMWKTGHSLIKARMKEVKAHLAGEMSGHFFFADRYLGYDDAIYASLRLVEILARRRRTIPELLAGLPTRVATPELRVACAEADKFRIVKEVAARLAARYPTLDLDGARYRSEGGWGLIRASNTQPVLVLRFEAESAEGLDRVQDILRAELEPYGLGF